MNKIDYKIKIQYIIEVCYLGLNLSILVPDLVDLTAEKVLSLCREKINGISREVNGIYTIHINPRVVAKSAPLHYIKLKVLTQELPELSAMFPADALLVSIVPLNILLRIEDIYEKHQKKSLVVKTMNKTFGVIS
jgi:hypothetical protein